MEEVNKSWCKLPYALILDERLTPADTVVYAVLLDKSTERVVKKTIKSIASLTGLSVRQIVRIIENLQRAGYIISKKTDGRRLILELKPLEAAEKKPSESPREDEKKPDAEEVLKSVLKKKLRVKTPENVQSTYDDLKAEAMARVKDPTKVLSYLSKMISGYEDKSDGFDAEKYEFVINNF